MIDISPELITALMFVGLLIGLTICASFPDAIMWLPNLLVEWFDNSH